MRVISGEFRSRRIKSLPGMEMRPTPDRLRETLFNIIAAEVPGATFLDAYAGTGAVGIEALSRGAARVVFLEKNKGAAALIRENLQSLGLTPRALLVAGAALKELPKHRADIVFLDPPYPLEEEYAPALESLVRIPPQLIIAQHSIRFDPGDRHATLARYRIVKQGDNALSFYRVKAEN
jgi:16S rRNA (guanine(966)-N(2))-methyltransferase RsmD